MEELKAYAKELVKQAEAIDEESTDEERCKLPVAVLPTFSFHPQTSEQLTWEFHKAIVLLHLMVTTIRDEGFERVTDGGRHIGRYVTQELQEAISDVKHVLDRV